MYISGSLGQLVSESTKNHHFREYVLIPFILSKSWGLRKTSFYYRAADLEEKLQSWHSVLVHRQIFCVERKRCLENKLPFMFINFTPQWPAISCLKQNGTFYVFQVGGFCESCNKKVTIRSRMMGKLHSLPAVLRKSLASQKRSQIHLNRNL